MAEDTSAPIPEPLALTGGAPVPLPEGAAPWHVTEGAVEVYLETPGGRRFLAHLGAGGAVFPPPAPARILLVGPEGAALSPAGAAEGDLVTAAEGWVREALAHLPLPAAPERTGALRPGDRGRAPAGGTMASAHGVVWLRLDPPAPSGDVLGADPGMIAPAAGLAEQPADDRDAAPASHTPEARGQPEARYGMPGGQITAGEGAAPEWHALHGRLWLSIADPAEITVADTATLARLGMLRAAMAGFSAMLMDLHAAAEAEREREARQRLGARPGEASDAAAEGSALTALAMAAEALGHSLEDRRLPDPGTDPSAIPSLARLAGLRARRLSLSDGWERREQGPLILSMGDTGALAAALWTGRRYAWAATGAPVTPAEAEAAEPVAFAIHPPLPRVVRGLATLAGHLWRGMARDARLAAVAGLGIAALGALVPLATGWLLHDIVPAGEAGLLMAVGLALAAAALVSAILNTVQGLAQARIGGRGAMALAAAMGDRVLRLPARFFAETPAGDLATRIASVEQMRQLVTGVMLSAGLTLVFSIAYLAVLFAYDSDLALLALFLVTGYGAAVVIGRLLQAGALREAAALDGRMATLTFETLAGLPKLRAAAAEERAMARWRRLYRRERLTAAHGAAIAVHVQSFSESWRVMALMPLFLAVFALAGSDMPAGYFIGFVAGFGAFQAAVSGFCDALLELYAAAPLVDRARLVLEAEPEDAGGGDPGTLSGEIEVSNLGFAYGPGMAPVLDGLSFRVRAGEHLAIVGASGSGKSTILRLLLGFERPDRGAIHYEGQELGHLDPALVRSQIGVVLQSSQLFAGSILENIRGAGDAPLETCLAAADQAGLGPDLAGLPMGVHTPVTDGVATLSGGQCQRILIARALAAEPRILFLDEATAALDNRTQAVVSASLEAISATRITIAHRLSTVRKADRIAVLEGGRFVETGTHDALVAAGSAYARLARRQLL